MEPMIVLDKITHPKRMCSRFHYNTNPVRFGEHRQKIFDRFMAVLDFTEPFGRFCPANRKSFDGFFRNIKSDVDFFCFR